MDKHCSCDCEECKKDDGLSCGCSACAHKHSSEGEGFWAEHGLEILRMIISTLLLIVAYVVNIQNETLKLVLCITAYVVSAYEIFINCIKGILHKAFLDENTLMFIASITAFCLGEYFEGVFIVVLYALGELLEDIATDNSRKKIAGLSELKSYSVRKITNTGFIDVKPEDVEEGSLIEVRKGDKVPIDGVLVGVVGEFDMKAITGESKPCYVKGGETVYSGAINTGDSVIVKTTKLYKDSTVEKIISMVEGANAQKAKSQKFITTFAKIYTPIVVLLAVLVAFVPPLFDSMQFIKWIKKSLNLLVVSCPCALVISVPLAFFVGIGNLAKNGILVKGSNYIDALSKVKITAFDKTGTLTKGEFSVEDVKTYNGFEKNYIAKISASIESASNHPISKAICSYADNKVNVKAFDVKEVAGKGMSGVVDNKKVLVGNLSLMIENGIDVKNDEKDEYYGTTIYVSVDNVFAGKILVCDTIKEEASETIVSLKKLGVIETVMFSGDNKLVCENVGKKINIDNIYAEMLPQDKAENIKLLKNKNVGNVLFTGDGINDAPSIAIADVGVAMGALGSEIAVESADVVIMDDNITKIPKAIKQAKKVRRKVLENIIGSLAIKIAIMCLSVTVGLPIWVAMFGDVGVMLLAVLNSLTAGK